MLLYGAFDAINLDGGGSTAIVAENSLGKPFLLNRPSSLGDSGRLRTVGSHFGVYAKPMPAFIHDVSAVPDDTQAEVIWTTENAASGQVRFGLTEELDHDSGVDSTLSTKHRMALSELVPDSTYYYQITSVDSGQSYVTPTYSFHTTNYVTSRLLIDLTNSWKYTTTPLKGSLWTKTDYDDSNWSGPEQALLWIDTRATGPNEDVQPKGFNLEGNPDNSSLPYTTYYFRTSLRIDSVASGATLAFSGFIDDGAVLYLNGEEIRRIRMLEAPEVVGNETFALATPCAGDATCFDEFKLLNPKLQPLSPGENVLAVEVHNASPLSRDITFGLTVSLIEPSGTVPLLTGRFDGGQLKLQWSRLGIRLQESEQAVGPWIDVLNSTTFQTYAAETSTRQKFYRLIR